MLFAKNSLRRSKRGIESIYGAILATILMSSFILIYDSYITNQQRYYEDIMRSMKLEHERSLENIYIERIDPGAKQIYLSSSISTKIIGIILRSQGETVFIDLRSDPVIVRGNLTPVPQNLSEIILDNLVGSNKIYVLTERGNIVSINTDPLNFFREAYRYYNFDYVILAKKDIYYILYGNWDVYILNTSLGQPQVYREVYFWDINTSYVIFRSPIDGYVFLKRSIVNKTILETKKWFSAPAPLPRDLGVVFSITTNLYGQYFRYSGRLDPLVNINISYQYNGSVIISNTTTIDFRYREGVALFNFSNIIVPYQSTTIEVRINATIPSEYSNTIALIMNPIIYVDYGSSTKQNLWASNQYYSNPSWVSGWFGLYVYSNQFSASSSGSYATNVYVNVPTYYWDYIVPAAQNQQVVNVLGYKYWTWGIVTLSNTTIYRPDQRGYITASNGYLIYDLTPQIYFDWVYK